MLKDLKHVQPEKGEPHWRGTLVLTLGGLPVPVRGWRFFADGRVEGPKARWGNRTVDVVPVSEELASQVRTLFEHAQSSPVERVFSDARATYGPDPRLCKRLCPHLFPACF